jgi:predicted flap endonuclease-1-like 5' DNA nuclease
MRERRAPEPDETPAARGPRTTARVLSALLSAAAVGIGAWFALRRRRPAMPAFADEARPASPVRSAPRTTTAPETGTPGASTAAASTPGASTPGASSPAATPRDPVPAEAPVGEDSRHAGRTSRPAPDPVPAEEPVPATSRRRSVPSAAPVPQQGEALLAVSGIGRRSAAALAAAGISDLRALADADTDTLARALEGAGLRRSPTLASWPTQARRLVDG